MQVRPAVIPDADRIQAAYLASWRAGYRDLLAPDVLEEEAAKRTAYDWTSEIRCESAHVAVAVDSNEIVGVVEAGGPPGASRDLPEITMLYVVPECWGTSAASQLLADGVRWIADQEWRAARLRVVEAQARARRFYEREGWRLDRGLVPAHNGFFNLVYYRRDLRVPIP